MRIPPDTATEASSNAHVLYALGLAVHGRFAEAVNEARRAPELDPLSFSTSNDLGVILFCSHRPDEATRQARRVLAIDPTFGPSLFLLGISLAVNGQIAAARRELNTLLV
jgi:Flp pilus assembly protein TadD